MSQASIASFFCKKPAAAAPAAQSKSDTKADVAASEGPGVETPEQTPFVQKSVQKKTDETPPTNTRKRLRPVQNSDSEEDVPAAESVSTDKDKAAEEKVAEDEVPSSNVAVTEELLSASPEKKKPQLASPVKKKEAADTSVKQFFTKRNAAVEPKDSPKKEKQDVEKEDTKSKKENTKADTGKAQTNMEKRKAEEKQQREVAAAQKAKTLKKTELGGGWGGSAVTAKAEAAGKDAASDDDDPMDEDDEEGRQELVNAASSFDASKHATWKKGEPVPYSHLANMFEKVEGTTKRLEMTAIVTKALRTVIETTPSDLLPAVYLSVNNLAPAHEGIELGIGDMILQKALAEATGRQPKDIKADYQLLGDLGKVANASRAKQRTMFKGKALTVQGVHKVLLQIAGISGTKSGDMKKDKIKGLLVSAEGVEAQYIMRQLQGKMRNGLGEQTVLVALAHAVAQSKGERTKEALEKAVEILKEVFSQLPCYDKVIPELLANPIADLPSKCFLHPGIPVKPMLAHPTKGIREVLDRFEGQTFTCEYKYDGERAQVSLPSETLMHLFDMSFGYAPAGADLHVAAYASCLLSPPLSLPLFSNSLSLSLSLSLSHTHTHTHTFSNALSHTNL
jgi:alkylhydroperoxidase/carboxymuconolactone decarboxylase family protein YurZ